MGTDCHIVINEPVTSDQLDHAVARIAQLERLWSRFIPSSEITRLGLMSGVPMAVSPHTLDLVEKAVLAWQLTDGAFDPTMLDQLQRLGYDRSFEQITESAAPLPAARSSAGCGNIVIDRLGGTIELPAGLGLDVGGLAKGATADLLAVEIVQAGAVGAMVNMGGDLRVRGACPTGALWEIALREPAVAEGRISVVHLDEGGIATSTTAKRRWHVGDEECHHLLNPGTGLPHANAAALVSVVAGEAWWAEVCATVLIGNAAAELPNCAALRLCHNGDQHRLGNFDNYERKEQ